MLPWLYGKRGRKTEKTRPVQREKNPLEQESCAPKPLVDPTLKQSLDSLGKAIRERPREKPEKPKAAPSAKVVQLPLWPEAKRGVPNSILRGALFAAVQGKGRVAMKRELLAAQRGIEIRFTGWQLDQSDLDVWEEALHLARQHPLGTRCDFTARGFLKALGRQPGGRSIGWLRDAFARLGGAWVEITHGPRTYAGSLIEARYENAATGLHMLRLNPELVELYAATRWTATDWEKRQRLRGKPLALWLYGFYSSHAEPHALRVETLHKLSGSRTKEIWKFKQNLIQALQDLEEADAIRSFEIEKGCVHLKTAPSKSQEKHLRYQNPLESGD